MKQRCLLVRIQKQGGELTMITFAYSKCWLQALPVMADGAACMLEGLPQWSGFCLHLLYLARL